jgi:hypothetical protein
MATATPADDKTVVLAMLRHLPWLDALIADPASMTSFYEKLLAADMIHVGAIASMKFIQCCKGIPALTNVVFLRALILELAKFKKPASQVRVAIADSYRCLGLDPDAVILGTPPAPPCPTLVEQPLPVSITKWQKTLSSTEFTELARVFLDMAACPGLINIGPLRDLDTMLVSLLNSPELCAPLLLGGLSSHIENHTQDTRVLSIIRRSYARLGWM